MEKWNQVILRNSSTPESGCVSLLTLLFAWRRTGYRKAIRIIRLVILSFSCLAAFTVAGGLSSNISTATGDDVLIRSTRCGWSSTPHNITLIDAQESRDAECLNSAFNYAQQCYSSSQSGKLGCDRFVTTHLPTETVDETAGCPFHDSLCRGQKENIRLDTGYIDSNDHLGLNAPVHQRFAMRYVLHCAPLQSERFTSRVVKDNKTWITYNYGKETTYSRADPDKNITYKIEDVETQYNSMEGTFLIGRNHRLRYVKPTITSQSQRLTYSIPSQISSATRHGTLDSDSHFFPLPDLRRPDGDLTLIFLSGNSVVYAERMNDLWYRATVPAYNISVSGSAGQKVVYRPESAASPMGCIEQYQWCNSAYSEGRGCGPLASQLDAIYGAASLFNLTENDLDKPRPSAPGEAGTRLIWPAMLTIHYPTFLSSLLRHLGAKSLKSQTHLFDGHQLPLPKEQWQLDVKHWWATLLSAFQASFVDSVFAPDDFALASLWNSPVNKEEQTMCDSQVRNYMAAIHKSISNQAIEDKKQCILLI